MWKACPICGKIHDINYKCTSIRTYEDTQERKLRSTNAWKRKSLEIRERAHNLCEVCKDKGVYTYNNLEVHHIEKIKNNKDKLLENYNLICLCSEHHKEADQGILDAEYLRKLAEDRESKDTPVG